MRWSFPGSKQDGSDRVTRTTCWCLAAMLVLNGCGTAVQPRLHFDEDQHGKYYETREGKILRIEQDGTVLDMTCAEPTLARGFPREDVLKLPCPTGQVSVVGRARAVGRDWDLTAYRIEPESGTCTSLFSPLSDSWTAEKRHSCAHRLWEVPAAAVAYPTIAVVVVGIATAPIWLPVLILTNK